MAFETKSYCRECQYLLDLPKRKKVEFSQCEICDSYTDIYVYEPLAPASEKDYIKYR